MEYEVVIGLEIHVQIKTESKMFSRAPSGFGAEPNTQTDPVVLGLPGTLPVINKKALDQIIRAGLMLGCKIAPVCRWDRKNYFYPDNPKNYQISQHDQPICIGGKVEYELPGPARNIMGEHGFVELNRIHLEEDVGKLNHFENDTLVDFNRAGVPLMEIVTEPVIHSSDEAFAFLTALKQAMIYGGISDCDMEKGQLRCDANISIRPKGQKELGVKVELKNLNSFSGVRNGIDYEVKRQIRIAKKGGEIVHETRRWDADSNTTSPMRTKEEATDYRFFPDPDLMPVEVDEAWISSIRETLPELPFDKQRRFFEVYDLPYTITSVLVPDHQLSDFFEEAVKIHSRPQPIANWIANDLQRELSAAGQSLDESKVRPAHIAALVKIVEEGTISNNIAKEVFIEMFQSGKMPEEIVEEKGLKQSTDTGELEKFCDDAIANNPKSVEAFLGGKENAVNFLKGQVMKASRGKANPQIVDQILHDKLNAMKG